MRSYLVSFTTNNGDPLIDDSGLAIEPTVIEAKDFWDARLKSLDLLMDRIADIPGRLLNGGICIATQSPPPSDEKVIEIALFPNN